MFGKIKDMFSLDRWIENFEGFLEAKIDLVKYDIKELLVNVLTKSIFFLGMAVFGLAGLVCFNFGLAYLLNYFIGNDFAGFFILTGIYFLITLVFYLNRDNKSIRQKIELSIRNSMEQEKQDTNSAENESTN
jgi:hypothetical protein